jgi:hypothetical protein
MGDGFVGVCLDLIEEKRRCFVVNVYAKCNLHDKRKLWSDILMSNRVLARGCGVCWKISTLLELVPKEGV